MSEIVAKGEKIGKELYEKRMTVSQLRKFLSAVNSISNKVQLLPELTQDLKNEIQYLRVKLAYQAGREGEKAKWFFEIIEPEIKAITNKKEYENFSNLVEAIVAYHKYYGGKN